MSGGGRRLALFLLAVILLVVFLRLPYYLKRPFFNVDEGTLAVVANTILDGGLPYRDSWDTRGPVTFYIYAGAFSLAGRNNMLGVHSLVMLSVILSSLFLMLLGRRLGAPLSGEVAGLLYPLVSFTYLKMDMLAANIEIFMVLFLLIGFYFFVRGITGQGRAVFFLSGLFFGLAFMTKQPALLDWAGAVFFLLFFTGSCGLAPGKRLRAAVLMASGLLLVSAAFASLFLLRGAFDDFLFGFWGYSSRFFMPAITLKKRMVMLYEGPWPLIKDNLYLWISAFSMAVLMAAGLVRRRGRAAPADLILLWGLTAFAGASWSGRAFGHYYIQLLPPLTLLSSMFTVLVLPGLIGKAARTLRGFFRPREEGSLPSSPGRATVLAVGIAFLACSLPLIKHYDPGLLPLMADSLEIAGEPAEQKNLRGYGRNLKGIVRHVRSNSSRDDTIFVWGFYPQVYLLTDRKPATRFSYCIYLTGLVPWVNVHPKEDTSRYIVPGSWDLLMSDLERNRPLFIIDTSPGDIYYWGKYPLEKFPRLKSYLDEYYVLDEAVENKKDRDMFHIYKRVEG